VPAPQSLKTLRRRRAKYQAELARLLNKRKKLARMRWLMRRIEALNYKIVAGEIQERCGRGVLL
jgi:hypothetical protein